MKEEIKEVFPRDPQKTYGLMALVEKGTPMVEKEPEDTVPTLPNLVYREFLATLLVTAIFWIISLLFDAPLEEIANPTLTPNPAKAPWYFVGLQELLVYFDPWIAGVILPFLIIIGLMLIPYIDPNPKGVGIYNFKERRLAFSMFTFGILLWFILIFIGSSFRGPNWAWYWPWENWEISKGAPPPLRSLPLGIGIILFLFYYGFGFLLPALKFEGFFKRLGFIRYSLFIFFLLTLLGVPLKIFARLIFGIKYLITTPWFNI